jgi:hypothetical protein
MSLRERGVVPATTWSSITTASVGFDIINIIPGIAGGVEVGVGVGMMNGLVFGVGVGTGIRYVTVGDGDVVGTGRLVAWTNVAEKVAVCLKLTYARASRSWYPVFLSSTE